MHTIPTTFARRGSDMVHINDVANGLGCGCVCPSCGDRMVAKQGAITIHHFAHEGGSDCAGGLETTLHLAAKAVLSRERRMVLPALTLTAKVRDAQRIEHHVTEEMISAQSVVFDEVTEEKRLGDIIPDLICKVDGRALLVEIAVTHFVDNIKAQKIRALDLACIEIDLSSMVLGWTWDSLRRAVVEGVTHKVWIANPRVNDLRVELQRQAEQKVAMLDQRHREAKRINIPGFDDALRKLSEFEEFEKSSEFQRERDALNETGPKEQAWFSATKLMKLEWDNPPDFIDIPVPGESVFLVARKVWQASLYAYIVGQAKIGTDSFHLRLISIRVGLMLPTRTEFNVLSQNVEFLTDSQKNALPSTLKPVSAYLNALVDVGYLKTDGIHYYLQKGAPHWKGGQ